MPLTCSTDNGNPAGGRQATQGKRQVTITAMPTAPQGTKPPSRQWQQTVSKQRQATAKQTQHSKYLRLQRGWQHIQSVGMQGRLYRSIQHDRKLDSSASKHNMPAVAYQPREFYKQQAVRYLSTSKQSQASQTCYRTLTLPAHHILADKHDYNA